MAVDPADITPALVEVAAHINHRTRVGFSAGVPSGPGVTEAGTFNAHTVPTATQATAQIARSARYVARELGRPGVEWDGALEDDAKDVVALHAALALEAGFSGDGSAVESVIISLEKRVETELESLLKAAQGNNVGGWRIKSLRMVTSQEILDAEEEA